MSESPSEDCWRIKKARPSKEQRDDCASFIGGAPILPPSLDLPTCRLCGANLTFFFQMEFPPGTPWGGRSIAVFASSECCHSAHLIPELVPGEAAGARIPEGFLDEYQKTFRVIVFDFKRSVMRSDYKRRIKYRPLVMERSPDSPKRFNKIGGVPTWYMEDEAPGAYGEYKMGFLGQIVESSRYDIEDGLPGQMVIDFFRNRQIVPSEDRYDELFIDAPLYLFGTMGECEPKVYIVVQKR